MSIHERGEQRTNPATLNRRKERNSLNARLLSEQQRQAVRDAMRCFLDDDLACGITGEFHCPACAQERSKAGAIKYSLYGFSKTERPLEFCNDCSTDYEMAHLSGVSASP